MKKSLISLVAACGTLLAANSASAATYLFDLTGSYAAQFTIDSSPVPNSGAVGVGFGVDDVQGTFPGALFDYVADVSFYDASAGGGLSIFDFYGNNSLLVADGPQLYTGSALAPTFSLGTFALTENGGNGQYSLTISAVPAAVPEPAVWAMMIVGFGMLGGAMRTGQRKMVRLRAA